MPATGLGGNWLPRPQPVFLAFVGEPTAWSLTPKGVEAQARSDPKNNPGIDCVALQAPFQMVWTDLKNIELAGTTAVLRSALNVDVERIVHLDQTTHAGARSRMTAIRSAAGTTARSSSTRGTSATIRLATAKSVPSGAQKHLVEYFELSADRTTLTYRFRLEDPEYLAAPFEGSAVWEHRPDLTYTAEECDLENARRYLEDL